MTKKWTAVATLLVLSVSSLAHAQQKNTQAHKRTTGIVLTSVGGSLLLSAPIVFMLGALYAHDNPTSYEAFGPIALGAIGGGTIGLGLLVPGIVTLASCRQPAWTDTRPAATGLRAFTFPLVLATF